MNIFHHLIFFMFSSFAYKPLNVRDEFSSLIELKKAIHSYKKNELVL